MHFPKGKTVYETDPDAIDYMNIMQFPKMFTATQKSYFILFHSTSLENSGSDYRKKLITI